MSNILRQYRLLVEGAISPEELNEVTKFTKYALYNSDEAKVLSKKLKEARAETDDKKRKQLYKSALTTAESLRKKAAAIPNNDFGDWAIDLCIKPLWWLIVDIVGTSAKGESLSGMSRSQALSHFDAIIKNIKIEMA